MKRREFITLLGGATVAWPLAARAQQGEHMRRIGVLMSLAETDPEAQARVAAFRKELQTLGWAEGRNVRIDIRWAASDAALMQRFAKELIALQPDLILSHNTPTTASLLQQTRTIPIVFVIVSDPVGSGFVASFPWPGGNITGFTNIEPTMAGKWLELRRPRPCHRRPCVLAHRAWQAAGAPRPSPIPYSFARPAISPERSLSCRCRCQDIPQVGQLQWGRIMHRAMKEKIASGVTYFTFVVRHRTYSPILKDKWCSSSVGEIPWVARRVRSSGGDDRTR